MAANTSAGFPFTVTVTGEFTAAGGDSRETAGRYPRQPQDRDQWRTAIKFPNGAPKRPLRPQGLWFARHLGIRSHRDPDHPISVLLPNESRIIGLPGGSGENIRGFSAATLLVVDEAARVTDELYYTARPILAVSGGDIWLLSTPRGKSGFFYTEWAHHQNRWERLEVPATECPRLPKEFLEVNCSIPPRSMVSNFWPAVI